MDEGLVLNENIIEKSLSGIKNPHLKNLLILTRLKQEISDCCVDEYGLEMAPFKKERIEKRLQRISELKRMGLKARDNDMSFYLNGLSPACLYCKMGIGPTVNITEDCTRNCFFCFQHRAQNKEQTSGEQRIFEVDNINFLKNEKFPSNIINLGISGGEPLLALDKVLEAIEVVKQRKKKKLLIRLYTNGDLLSEDILKRLKHSGLDEIRFGFKYGDFKVLRKIVLAKEYIPRVLMEGPVFPKSEKFMEKLLSELNDLKIFGINLLDLRCRFNVPEYKKRRYLLDYKEKSPFYEDWSQGWPIYGSEETIFNLLEFSIKKRFSMSVHYCPVKQNIKVAFLNARRIEASRNKKHFETVTEEGLLKKIVVYYPSHLKAIADLRKKGVPEQDINISKKERRLETHIKNLKYLNLSKYEVGILYSLPGGEEVDIKVLKSTGLDDLSADNTRESTQNNLSLTHIGKSIANVYFMKKSEKQDNALRVINIVSETLKILPAKGAIYLTLGYIYYFQRKYHKAIWFLKKVKDSGYKDFEVYLLLGSCYDEIKEYAKAVEELKEAEMLNSKEAKINFILAKCFGKLGQMERSKKEITKGYFKNKVN